MNTDTAAHDTLQIHTKTRHRHKTQKQTQDTDTNTHTPLVQGLDGGCLLQPEVAVTMASEQPARCGIHCGGDGNGVNADEDDDADVDSGGAADSDDDVIACAYCSANRYVYGSLAMFVCAPAC